MDRTEDVTPDQIQTLIVDRGPDYWEAGSGDAALRFTDGTAQGEIIFMVRDPIGVFVQFRDSRDQRVLSTAADESENVTIEQDGDPWELPRAFFVHKSCATAANREFMTTGKKAILDNWVSF